MNIIPVNDELLYEGFTYTARQKRKIRRILLKQLKEQLEQDKYLIENEYRDEESKINDNYNIKDEIPYWTEFSINP